MSSWAEPHRRKLAALDRAEDRHWIASGDSGGGPRGDQGPPPDY